MMLLHWDMLLRLLVAAVLGSVIGIDRERLVWAAGLRTHMLVCVGACLFMIVSAYGFAGVLGDHVVLDPSRIAAQVVSGIGFLGAGSILLRGEVVRGLTTAASLWTVAAIGLAVGGGLYLEAVAATVLILIILAGIKPLEQRFQRRALRHEIQVRAARGGLSMDRLNQLLGAHATRVTRFVCLPSEDGEADDITITLKKITPAELETVLAKLRALPHVQEATRPNL